MFGINARWTKTKRVTLTFEVKVILGLPMSQAIKTLLEMFRIMTVYAVGYSDLCYRDHHSLYLVFTSFFIKS